MLRAIKFVIPAVAIGICLSTHSTLRAQERNDAPIPAAGERDQTWYQQPSNYRPDTRAIIHRKAQARAAQRDARLASLHWYGMSNSRPTAAPTPFSSLYSPVWQQPGGRPFAWSTSNWPSSVVYVR